MIAQPLDIKGLMEQIGKLPEGDSRWKLAKKNIRLKGRRAVAAEAGQLAGQRNALGRHSWEGG